MKRRFNPPITLIAIAVVLLASGYIFNGMMGRFSEDLLRKNMLVYAIPFLAIFVGILLLYIALIVTISRGFSGYLPARIYRPLFTASVVGIVVGVVMMFQPWLLAIYRAGFSVLLISLLSFMVVSHITPRYAELDEA